MSKKLYGLLLPIMAVAAFAMMTGAAQAAPHWYLCEKDTGAGAFEESTCAKALVKGNFELKRLPFTSAKTRVATFAELTLTLTNGASVKCAVEDRGKIWNTILAEAGMDEITRFENYECESSSCPSGVTLTAKGLPWKTILTEAAPPTVRDNIKGIEVELVCTGVLTETFKGELSPKWVNASLTNSANSYAEFDAGAGELTGPGNKAKVTGNDYVVGLKDENVLVKNP